MKAAARYYVEIWDTDLQEFTPQIGVRTGPYSKWGLRKAIRKLRELGYSCEYSSSDLYVGDPSVSIYRKATP